MVQKVVSNCLRPIVEAEERLRRRKIISVVFALGTVGFAVFIYLAVQHDWWSAKAVVAFLGVLAATSLGGFLWSASRKPDLRELARRVEKSHPELRAALLTAMDQKPDRDGRLGYLQSKVLGDVAEHAVKNQWVRRVSNRQLSRAAWIQFAAITAFFLSVWMLLGKMPEDGLLSSGGAKK